ncbi:MAG: hypothetical protein B6I22_14735, partial [Desulfobacteraceae bacterium 4572_123]
MKFKQTLSFFPVDLCLHHLVEAAALKYPDAAAVSHEHRSITYRTLDNLTNQIARHLISSGVGPGTVAALYLPVGVDAVVGVLGILKAGGAYLSLDPTYPKNRIAQMLEDSRAPVILTRSDCLKSLPDTHARMVCLDTDRDRIASENTTKPSVHVTPDDLAYIIFTSGSTGRPKGNFDVSVYEIFSSLTAGAELKIVPDKVRPDPLVLMEWLLQHRITSAYLPPMMVADLAAWVEVNPGQSLLRRLLVGVEPIPEKLLVQIAHNVSGVRIINGYGPTEATICASLYDVKPQRPLHANTPIGKPVRNMRIYLLDKNLQPVEPGTAGEICISGIGVANGYLNRPGMTNKKFVIDPFSSESGMRMYKTGDQARLLTDGNLEFIGRTDFQVKFHGYRIETGEIETALRTHPSVREAVVLLRQDPAGIQSLVAYLVCGRGGTIAPDKVKAYLKNNLPEYMIPSIFIFLDRIPITANGKTDRKALPAPGAEDFKQLRRQTYDAPETETEIILCAIFETVLGSGPVGRNDHFFEMGGHSLLATRVCSLIQEKLGIRLPLSTLFERPVVRDFASVIHADASPDRLFSKPIVHETGNQKNNPLSFPQQAIWLLNRMDEKHTVFNIPLVVKIKGALRIRCFQDALNAVIHRHSILRTTFHMADQTLFQARLPELVLTVPVKDLSHLKEPAKSIEFKRAADDLGNHVFDLTTGPLLKAVLIKDSADEYRMLLTIHHIIMD